MPEDESYELWIGSGIEVLSDEELSEEAGGGECAEGEIPNYTSLL